MTVTKQFSSALEGSLYFDPAMEAKITAALTSFWYCRKRETVLRERKKKFPQVDWMLDSGAHTLFSSIDKAKATNFDEFTEEYVEFIHRNKDYIWAAVNMDIGLFVGVDKVKEWDKKYFKPLEREGVRICYVCHDGYGSTAFADMCKEHRYVGLPNDMLPYLQTCRATARKYLTSIHGFGLTDPKFVRENYFATADSATWTASGRYGVRFYYKDRLIRREDKDKRDIKENTAYFKQYGISQDLLMENQTPAQTRELIKMALIAWRLFCEDMERKHGGVTSYWDLRPPISSAVKYINDNEIPDWLNKLRLPVSDEGIDEDRAHVFLASAILNSEYKRLRKCAELISLVFDFLPSATVITEQATDEQLETLRKDYADYITANIQSDLIERTAEEYKPIMEYVERSVEADAFDRPDQPYFDGE